MHFMEQTKYKGIAGEFKEGLKHIQDLHTQEVKAERIEREAKEIRENLTQKLKQFFTSEIEETEKKLTNLNVQSQEKTYTDPITENLRRQDFDIDLELMSNIAAIAYIEDKGEAITSYEIKKIAIKFPGDETIRTKLREFETAQLAEVSPERKDLEQYLGKLQTAQQSHLVWFPGNEGDSAPKVVSLSIFDYPDVVDKNAINDLYAKI